MALQNADEMSQGLMKALSAKIRAGDWDSVDAEKLKGLLWSLWADSRDNFDRPEYVFPVHRDDKDRTVVHGPRRSGSGPAARELLKELFEALKGSGRRKVRSQDRQKWERLYKHAGGVKLKVALRYLEAKKEAERRASSAFDILRERLQPPPGQPFTKFSERGERLSEDDLKNPVLQALAIREVAMWEMQVARDTLAEVKRKGFTATPKGIAAALGLSRRTRPRFRAQASGTGKSLAKGKRRRAVV